MSDINHPGMMLDLLALTSGATSRRHAPRVAPFSWCAAAGTLFGDARYVSSGCARAADAGYVSHFIAYRAGAR